ncbi:MAG: bacterial transcriptional activator domain-containing protein, partial [Caldilineaceae bacterium]|nr:bacterial transcriptional activator domain-containing protein [Caldilineaceae bacterium]
MSQLTIRLFGSPQILLDGTPVQIAGHIPLALLAYLALTGQHHSRDTLATFFWPDARQPRTQLRNNWWLMREALGPAGAAWLHSDRDTLGFRPDDKLWLDVAHFRRATATVDAHADCAEQLCATCLAALQDAVALYRDDLLAGFALRDCPAFEEWHFFEREALRRNFAGVLETLVLHHCRQAEFAPAIHYARRRLALDTLHEPAHRWLMQLYAWSGEHAAALRQYQTCRRLLEAELHALPDPETEQLYQAIRTRTLHPPHRASPPALATHAAKDQEAFLGRVPFATTKVAGHGQAQVQPPHNLPAPKSSLVGRKNEQAAVEAILRTPEARLITLIGPG